MSSSPESAGASTASTPRRPLAKRASEWAAVLPKVKDADTRRSQMPVGARPTEARSVPLAPGDEETFDQRQAELGRRYAARTAAA